MKFRAALVHYCFVPRRPAGSADDGSAYLGGIWRACVDSLAMTQFVEGFEGASLAFDDIARRGQTADERFRVLAAVERPSSSRAPRSPKPVYQAFLFELGDARGVVAQQAPNVEEPTLGRWGALHQEWADALGRATPPEEVLGEALVFSALVADGAPAAHTLAGLVRSEVPEYSRTGPYRTELDITLWGELEVLEETARLREPRRLVALAPEELERELVQMLWWDLAGGRSLASLARYLLHAAKLRHSAVVLDRDLGGLRAIEKELDTRVDSLLRGPENVGGQPHISDALIDAQSSLDESIAELGSLLARNMTRVQELRQTALVAEQNMRITRPRPGSDAGNGSDPFAADVGLSSWLQDQTEHELAYARAARDRAEDARSLISSRLREARDAQRNHLILVQGSLLNALVAALAAIQVLNPTLPISRRTELPVVAVVGAAALAFPFLAVHFFEPFGLLDRVAAGLLGAATGWLVVVAAWDGAGPLAQALAAVGGLALIEAVLIALDALVARRRRLARLTLETAAH